MDRVGVSGGWGCDRMGLRASMVVDNGLNVVPVPNAHLTEGSPDWEALAYGGAGQDIFFAGTGGDRLIDWVGNPNSYYLPLSQVRSPPVSPPPMPLPPAFPHPPSKSDGAHPTPAPRRHARLAR